MINRAMPTNPVNADPKKPTELNELQITDIQAAYLDDVNGGWFSKEAANPANRWAAGTVHNLDKNSPPSGAGWLFTLTGHHFHKDGAKYTLTAALDTPHGLQSAVVRHLGISSAVLVSNVTRRDWVPGSEDRASGKRATRTGGATRTVAAGPGQGQGMGGGDLESAPSEGNDAYAAGPGSEGGSAGMGAGQGAAGEGGQAFAGTAPITKLPRTDFEIQFIWQPTERAKRKPIAEIQEALTKAGKRDVSKLDAEPAPAAPPAQPGSLTPAQPAGAANPAARPPATAPATPGGVGGQPNQTPAGAALPAGPAAPGTAPPAPNAAPSNAPPR
jgi:hypothetical protein